MSSFAKRSDGGWRARYRDSAGREHARHFARKVDAQRWLDETTASIVTGVYVDPRAGKITVRQYAEQWQASQSWRPKTAQRVESSLRIHVFPVFGDRPIAAVRPSEVQAWVRRLSSGLSPSSTKTVYSVVRGLMRSAALDRVVAASPCVRVALPATGRKALTIPSAADVVALPASLPAHLAAVPYVAAGLGLRPGEVFGLEVGDVDFLRRTVAVVRQSRRQERARRAEDGRVLPDGAIADSGRRQARSTSRSVRTSRGLGVHRRGGACRSSGTPSARRGARPVLSTGLGTLRLHDMRHASASALIAAGESR